jgi:type III secretory pathway component EscT
VDLGYPDGAVNLLSYPLACGDWLLAVIAMFALIQDHFSSPEGHVLLRGSHTEKQLRLLGVAEMKVGFGLGHLAALLFYFR